MNEIMNEKAKVALNSQQSVGSQGPQSQATREAEAGPYEDDSSPPKQAVSHLLAGVGGSPTDVFRTSER